MTDHRQTLEWPALPPKLVQIPNESGGRDSRSGQQVFAASQSTDDSLPGATPPAVSLTRLRHEMFFKVPQLTGRHEKGRL